MYFRRLQHPLYLLALIYEQQFSDRLWAYDSLLHTLVASHTELSHFDIVITFSVKFEDFCLASAESTGRVAC
jgi:hypothetical protein